MSKNQPVSNERLAEIDVLLARLNQAWMEWDQELGEVQKRLEDSRMDKLEALAVIHRRQMDSLRGGTAPFDFGQLNQLLDEMCCLYLSADQEQRLLIRGFFEDKSRVRKYLHSYIGGRAAPRLESTGDGKWLSLGLAAASIVDQRVDYRDLLICLGALWLSAEEAGIAPARRFSSVARISNREPVYGNRSTRDFLRGFRTSAHLKSIKQKRAAC